MTALKTVGCGPGRLQWMAMAGVAIGALACSPPNLDDQAYEDEGEAVPQDRSVADLVLGQPDMRQIVPGEIAENGVSGAGGVLVDRRVRPNRVYIFDGQNSRILGYSALGHCDTVTAPSCTTDEDCAGSRCIIDVSERAPDLLIGQLSTNTSACNGDGTVPLPASASTLCSQQPGEHSPYEGGSFVQMALDPDGNLFVPDYFNNRVLRYDDPFANDSVADAVWGQEDFTKTACNRGAEGAASASSLCFDSDGKVAGVDIDAAGNLWVADSGNNRVVRFPYVGGAIAPSADLVLGQKSLSVDGFQVGSELDQMHLPSAVKVLGGVVYVADTYNNRVLAFDPPVRSGTSGRVFGDGIKLPTGLAVDVGNTAGGALWINDTGNERAVLMTTAGEQVQEIKSQGDTRASVGVTESGAILVAASSPFYNVTLFEEPLADMPAGRTLYPQDLLANEPRDRGLQVAVGVAVSSKQLIVADAYRLVYWNMAAGPGSLSDNAVYDGIAGVPSGERFAPHSFFRIAADDSALWVIRHPPEGSRLERYDLPLLGGDQPTATLWAGDLMLLGQSTPTGKVVTLTDVSIDAGGRLWLAAAYSNRVFRVDPETSIIDIMIGGETFPEAEIGWNDGQICETRDPKLLCYPGAASLDRSGNLFIAESYLEFHGSKRLRGFDASLFPDAPDSLVVLDGDAASVGFEDVGAWKPAFSRNSDRVAMGFSHYQGISRQPHLYENLMSAVGGELPAPMVLAETTGQPFSSAFDEDENLYVADLTWGRVLVYADMDGDLCVPSNDACCGDTPATCCDAWQCPPVCTPSDEACCGDTPDTCCDTWECPPVCTPSDEACCGDTPETCCDTWECPPECTPSDEACCGETPESCCDTWECPPECTPSQETCCGDDPDPNCCADFDQDSCEEETCSANPSICCDSATVVCCEAVQAACNQDNDNDDDDGPADDPAPRGDPKRVTAGCSSSSSSSSAGMAMLLVFAGLLSLRRRRRHPLE